MMNEHFLITLFIVKYVESNMEGYIYGGHFTTMKLYPHQVFLDINALDQWICGGSILNQVIVLTAAHCLEDYDGNGNQKVMVKYGSKSLESTKMRIAKSFKVHRNYNCKTMYADIALLQCRAPIKLGKLAQRVALMKKPPDETTAYVAGWGAIDDNLDTTDILKEVQQKIQTSSMCSKLHMPKGVFCAGADVGGGHPAIGDSGSALIVNKFIQIGIVSYKVEGYTIIAYTNISHFYSWIRKNAADMYCIK